MSPRNPACSLLAVVCVFCSTASPAAGQGFSLRPGDVVIADTQGDGTAPAVRIRHLDRSLSTVAQGAPLVFPADVFVDRDGAILVSNWRSQFAPENGVYRIDPASGLVTRLSSPATPLQDNFQLVRDGRGDIVVADGFAGLARVAENGTVSWFSPSAVFLDVNIGIVLDYDGFLLAAESPNYSIGNVPPGRIHRVNPVTGFRQLLGVDPALMPNPNGLALDRDGSLLVTDALSIGGGRRGLVRMERSGVVTALQTGLPLGFPSDVEAIGEGWYLVADSGAEAVLVRKPGGAMAVLTAEDDDGNPVNGVPVDRPFGLALVPRLWLKTPLVAAPGQTVRIEVRGTRFAAVRLAVSRFTGPTAMNLFWPGDPQTSHVDLVRAFFQDAVTDQDGLAVLDVALPGSLAPGSTLHLQALQPGRRILSNYVPLPVR